MEKDRGQQWPQILAICIGSLTSLSSGLALGWTSPSLPLIVEDKVNYDINEEEATYFAVIPPIAMILTVPVFSKLNDDIGRKKIIFLMGIFHIISWSLISSARSIYVFYLARIFNGMSDACTYSAVPMYIGEVATPEVRGQWGNILSFNIYLGQCLINIIGSYLSVAHTAYVVLIIPGIFLISFPFMPDSPYFYIMKGRYDDAKAALKWLRRKNNIEPDFLSLKADVTRQMSESGTWTDLFRIKSNRKALYAGLFLRISQQFAGISVFSVFTQFIFSKAGGSISAQLSSILFTAAICILNFVAGIFLDRCGRQKSYMFSLLSSGLVLLLMSVYFYIDQYKVQINLSSFEWIPLAGMMTYVLFYSFGLGIVPTLMLGELFSASIKVKGLCFLSIVYGTLISSITKIFYILYSSFGLFCPFLIFSISCLVSTVLTLYFVPETSGKSLEEIQQALKGNKKNKGEA